jgi:hypothetical protein
MIFYAIFWTTYLPFVLVTLSILAERLTQPTDGDAATQAKPASSQPGVRPGRK